MTRSADRDKSKTDGDWMIEHHNGSARNVSAGRGGRACGPDEVTFIARSLEAGVLADHPGPALLVDGQGGVMAYNVAAAILAHGYREGAFAGLAEAVARARHGAGAQIFRLDDPEIATTIDFAVIPVGGKGAVLALGRDVSLDQNLRGALIDSRQRYKDLIEIAADFAWETGENGQFVFVSAAGAIGYDPDDLVGQAAAGFLVREGSLEAFNPFVTEEPLRTVEVRFRCRDGGAAILEVSAAPLHDPDGFWRGARGICRDVTEARRRDAALAKAQNRERLTAYIVSAIRDEVEPDKMLAAATGSAQRALDADGVALFQILPGSGLTLSHQAGAEIAAPDTEAVRELVIGGDGPVVLDTRDGSVLAHRLSYHQDMNGAVMLWRRSSRGAWEVEDQELLGELSGQFGIAIRQAEAHNHLRVLSSTDAMTGLLNRRAFMEALSARLAESGDPRWGALAYVDLDNFKQVNDVRGHQVGDRALIHLARLLTQQARSEDLVARLGGDEFALWLESTGTDDARRRAEAILEAGRALRQYSGSEERPVGLSIGMAMHAPGSGNDMDGLIRRADQVMYEIKHGGKGWYRIADASGGANSASPSTLAQVGTSHGQ